MSVIKQWVYYVCITALFSTMFSLVNPSGNMGRFYKIIISLFIFVSLLSPLSVNARHYTIPKFDVSVNESYDANAQSIENMIEGKVKQVLEASDIPYSSVDCKVHIDSENVASIDSVTVYVGDMSAEKDIKQLVFDKLSINVGVAYVGG